MIAKEREATIDILRGMAVLGFILWHSYDIFCMANKYHDPLFRSAILTRVTFVMTSASAFGLSMSHRSNIRRGVILMMYPVIIGIAKVVYTGSYDTFTTMALYPFGGSDDFTFSILTALGMISIWVPLMLRSRIVSNIMLGSACVVMLVELLGWVKISPFWQLMFIALFFSTMIRPLLIFTKSRGWILQIVIAFGILFVFSQIVSSEDSYWIVRGKVVYIIAMLFGALVIISLAERYLIKGVIRDILMVFSTFSLFIYFFHYFLLTIVYLGIGGRSLGGLEIVLLSAVVAVISYATSKYSRHAQYISTKLI